MSRVTLATLKSAAKKKGLLIEDDKQAKAIRVTCPDGMRFEPELHELVQWYEDETMPGWRAEAIRDALQDVKDYDPEPCDNPNCDWCDR